MAKFTTWIKAQQGFPEAQYKMGYCYQNGDGMEKNPYEAFKWYMKAAQQGDAVAQCSVGMCYASGDGIEKNPREAFIWYMKAAQQEYAEAQYMIGLFYEDGYGTEKNLYEAFKWYMRAAQQGDAVAQCSVGMCYASGNGTEKNPQEAFIWYMKAAQQGYAVAQFNVGYCYDSGDGIKKNPQEAFRWYMEAAQQGYVEAQFNVGYCYNSGNGIEKNPQEAFIWYMKAAQQGLANAQYKIGGFYLCGDGTEKNPQEAFIWCMKAAQQGLANAQYMIGLFYEDGYGTEKNPQEAFRWYMRAAQQGYADAQDKIKLYYPQVQSMKADNLHVKNDILLKLDTPIRIHLQKNQMLFIEKIIVNENFTTLCVDNQGIKLNICDKKMEYIKNIDCKNCEEHMIKYNTLLYVLVTTLSTCMDIWQDLLPYDIRDMCNSMTNQMNVQLNSYGIKTELTAQGWYFFYDNKPITFEEVIRKLPDDISFQEYKTDSKLHMSNAVWKYESINIESGYDSAAYSVVPDGTMFFYECAYLCPSCNRFMNKILLNHSIINVSGNEKAIDKAFSCKYCNEFFAPVFNQKLSSGFLYHLKTDSQGYKSIVKDMDSCGRRNNVF